jgi:hypothetical protein
MKYLVSQFLFGLLLGINVNAQIFTETFNYNEGALMDVTNLNITSPYYPVAQNNVSNGVWTNGSTSTFDDPILVQAGALTYPGYTLSGVGKKIFCPNLTANTSNNRGFATFPTQQTVYYSFMIKMKDVTGLSAYPSTNGEYFTGVWATGNATNANYRGLTCFQAGSAIGKWRIGVRSNQPTTVATSWVGIDLDTMTTYLVVVKYERNNPTCKASLWLNPSLLGSEPTPDAVNDFGAVDPIPGNTDVGRFGIYQRGDRPHVWLGGIRVGTTWGTSATPVELTSFSAVASKSDVKLMWVTASELNNAGFEVERTITNSNSWMKVGFVPGTGTSTTSQNYIFVDENLAAGKYVYRIKQVDFDGSIKYYGNVEVELITVGQYYLSEAYPNPFNPSTNINFTVAENSITTLKIYNSLGQLVNTIFNGIAESGKDYNVIFSGDNLSNGIYFAVLESANKLLTKKLILLK